MQIFYFQCIFGVNHWYIALTKNCFAADIYVFLESIMDIYDGAKIIVNDWLQSKRDEVLHFITDENHLKEADAFEKATLAAGAVPKITVLPSGEIQSGDVFDELQATMPYANAIIGATHFSFITVSAVDYSLKKGSRFLSLPLHTNDGSSIFENDFITMNPHVAQKKAKPIIKHLKKASKITVKTNRGTDVTFTKEKRIVGLFSGECSKKKTIASSSFEIYIPIEETTTNGTIVVDGSLGYLGVVEKPLTLHFKNGYLTEIEDTADGKKLKEYLNSFHDKEMLCAAEFGIGLNEKARCRGVSYIEDESAFKTFHVGFGRNIALGGNHDAAGHFDIVTKNPDIWAGDIKIMENGNLCF